MFLKEIIMKLKFLSATFICISLFVSSVAQAGFIESNYKGMDTAIDDSANLMWLNWEATSHLNRIEVEEKLQAGQELSEWRYATYEEILGMVEFFFPKFDKNSSNFSYSTTYNLEGFRYTDELWENLITHEILEFERFFKPKDQREEPWLKTYSAIFGDVTFDNDWAGYLGNNTQALSILDSDLHLDTYQDVISVIRPEYGIDYNSVRGGHALVRVTKVPETPSLSIFILAIIGLLYSRAKSTC
ncbi:MAG: hypothetical protein ACI89T_001863 [Cognaticolwellia sp.]|jgi:hypothetical protein